MAKPNIQNFPKDFDVVIMGGWWLVGTEGVESAFCLMSVCGGLSLL